MFEREKEECSSSRMKNVQALVVEEKREVMAKNKIEAKIVDIDVDERGGFVKE